MVREAVGVAAYHAGDFTEAARELRAYRRMSGDDSYRAVLADCERALGRPDVALRLVAEALTDGPPAEEVVELRLVEAGARQDLGELPAAALVLEAALGGRPTPEQLDSGDLGQLRLATAYADLLVARGEDQQAHTWFEAVMAADPDDETGVAARFDDVDYDEDEDEDGDDEGVVDSADGEAEDDEAEGDAVEVPVVEDAAAGSEVAAEDDDAVEDDADEDDADEDDDVSPEEAGLGTEYDPDEQDVESEVAELLGEIPAPGSPTASPPSRSPRCSPSRCRPTSRVCSPRPVS
ncbi:tol-pal system YbgF family protein [Klenkia terrae]|uniref:tetratricopeptide repeat protein n=1 Tax=Klenkia terrae TaxID=1052259 RepID=UPI003616DF3B